MIGYTNLVVVMQRIYKLLKSQKYGLVQGLSRPDGAQQPDQIARWRPDSNPN